MPRWGISLYAAGLVASKKVQRTSEVRCTLITACHPEEPRLCGANDTAISVKAPGAPVCSSGVNGERRRISIPIGRGPIECKNEILRYALLRSE